MHHDDHAPCYRACVCERRENMRLGFCFADLSFMDYKSTMKTAKIGYLKNFRPYGSLIPIDPTPKRRKGSGDIGTDSWFCKLSNHVIIRTGLYGAQDQENAWNVPRPFPHVHGGVWDETTGKPNPNPNPIQDDRM